jgi:hypothetical protein
LFCSVLTNSAHFPYIDIMEFPPRAARTVAGEKSAAARLPWNRIVPDLALFAWAGVLSLTGVIS